MHIYISKLCSKINLPYTKYFHMYCALVDKFAQRNMPREMYHEGHHIFPRCFCSLEEIKDKRNIIIVTSREHFILHRLLAKIHFIDSNDCRSMRFALSCFNRNKEKRNLTSRQYEITKKAVVEAMTGRIVSQETKNKASQQRSGMGNFYDNEGNSYFLKTTDPKIHELKLVGNQSKKVISIDGNGNTKVLEKDDQRLLSGEYYPIRKGKATYITKDGSKITLNIDDPLIIELGLAHVNKGKTGRKMPKDCHKGHKNGMYGRIKEVCCFDLENKVFLRIDRETFLSSDRYVGVNNLIAKTFRKSK